MSLLIRSDSTIQHHLLPVATHVLRIGTCCVHSGLQLFADDLGGWGGITHDVLQQLRDQYPSQPVLYFSLQQQQQLQDASAASPVAGLSPAHIR